MLACVGRVEAPVVRDRLRNPLVAATLTAVAHVQSARSDADGRLLAEIPVGSGPHGLCLFPQPGRYSLGHTGNFR